jgi:hypothetical protein
MLIVLEKMYWFIVNFGKKYRNCISKSRSKSEREIVALIS